MKTNTTTPTALTIAEVMKQGNSTVNQNIKGEFIAKHVYCNINSMVEYILSNNGSNAPFDWDNITNYFTYSELIGKYVKFDGGTEDERNEEIERLRDLQADLYNQIIEDKSNEEEIEAQRELIESEIEELENLESEPQDIFEWWMVSDFLATKLEEQGYCIIDSENIWGRTTTGQAILLDYVITQICADMEILEGQANSWANS